MVIKLKPKRMIITELGVEKLCSKCNEYWPADNEFFYRGSDRFKLHGWCKACVDDETHRRRNG